MKRESRLVFFAAAALALLPGRAAIAADHLQQVLHELDAAAVRFHSTSADFEFDSIQTDPIPDKDVQKGVVYYARKDHAFEVGIHIREVNGKASPKVLTISHGVSRLYEKMVDQVTTFHGMSKYEGYMELGFGASGKDLAAKWEIKYLGSETMDGVKTEKLELVAKDPAVRKNFPKVTVWMDTERGLSLKQVFDEGQGQYRVCTYFNIKMNQALPGDAFTFKTDSHTQYVNR